MKIEHAAKLFLKAVEDRLREIGAPNTGDFKIAGQRFDRHTGKPRSPHITYEASEGLRLKWKPENSIEPISDDLLIDAMNSLPLLIKDVVEAIDRVPNISPSVTLTVAASQLKQAALNENSKTQDVINRAISAVENINKTISKTC